jgi:hypothetical protein
MSGWRSAAIVALVAATATAAYLQYAGRGRLAEVRRQEAAARLRIEQLSNLKRVVDIYERRREHFEKRTDVLRQLTDGSWPIWGASASGRRETPALAGESPWVAKEAWGELLLRLTTVLEDEVAVNGIRIRDGRLGITLSPASRARAERLAKRLEGERLIVDPVVRNASTEEAPGGGVVLGARLKPPPVSVGGEL